jgi:cytochrome P450
MLSTSQNIVALATLFIAFGLVAVSLFVQCSRYISIEETVPDFCQIIFRAFASPLKAAPGPWHSHFTRLPLSIAIVTGRRPEYVDSLHKKYGRFVRIAPNELAVSDINSFHHIHRIGTDFMKSDWYHQMTGGGSRRSLFTFTTAKDHSVRRRMFSKPMSRKSLLENWHDTVKDTTRLAVRKMHDAASSEGKVNVLDWWTFMAMDTVGRLMYGRSFGNLERGSVSSRFFLTRCGYGCPAHFHCDRLRNTCWTSCKGSRSGL